MSIQQHRLIILPNLLSFLGEHHQLIGVHQLFLHLLDF